MPDSATNKRVRLLIVDDHEVILVGLKTVLERVPWLELVGEARTAKEAVTRALALTPDVVLMDVRLPDGSGIVACREILQALPATAVLFLTSYADDDFVMAAVLAGGRGYVLKEIGTAGLVEAIRTVASGGSVLDPVVTTRAMAWLKGQGAPTPNLQASLSPQQQRVLALLAEGKTNKEIASDLGLSDKTVKNYIAALFEKLGVSRRSQAVAVFLRR